MDELYMVIRSVLRGISAVVRNGSFVRPGDMTGMSKHVLHPVANRESVLKQNNTSLTMFRSL